jgi:YegS/Rv2252/BmrU family lipid kinase
MPHYQIIVNPTSGRGAGLTAVPHIKQYLDNQGWTYDICLTERPWHAAELAQAAVAAGHDVVVGVGGDGTANEIINGLMLAQKAGLGTAAMGILAVGRGNDFAFSMHIPAGLEAGLHTLALDHREKIDIGRVSGGDYPQGRYFGNGIGIGFDAVVGFEALKLTWLTGFPSYLVAVLKTLFLYFRAPLVQVDYDQNTLTLPALMVSIMNGRRMGGGFMMAPNSSKTDGLLDLCIAKQVSRGRILTLIPHFLKGTQATQEPIVTARAGQVKVTAVKGVLPAHADGETLCTQGEQLSIELLPTQIDLICQPQQETA